MKSIVLLLFIFIGINSLAQNITIYGILQDLENNPIPYANIILKKQSDSTLVKATFTFEDGSFDLQNIESGNYLLQISILGFNTKIKELNNLNSDLNLGTIELVDAAEELNAVNVIVEKPLVQVLADKTIFNVENTINAAGTNGWELLRKAPGLIIDNNGNIILEGKTGVQIYIDGKPSILRGDDLQGFLEGLQSNDIESIEIITQPSSKYDAAGNAGIINLKLKRDKTLGTNGSLSSGLTVGDFGRPTAAVSFNTRNKKSNIYSSYSNGFGQYSGFLFLDRRQNGKRFNAKTFNVYERNSNNFRMGYDLFASPKSTFGFLLNANTSNNINNSDSRTPIRPIMASVNDSVLVANNRSDGKTLNYNANINYKYSDTLGHTVNVDADFGKYDFDGSQFQPNRYLNGNETEILSENASRQETPIKITIATFKTDYEQRVLKGVLGVGFKFSYVDTDNTFSFFNRVGDAFIVNEDRSNQFNYTENINAAYLNFNRKWEKWNLQLGLRMENTSSEGNLTSIQEGANDNVKRNYTDWFPSGGLTYQLNQKNQFAINYSKRVARPNYSSLNPFEYKIDELSFRRGNPFLQPQYTDNVKMSHTFNYKLNTSITYTFVSDFFAQVTQAEGENRNFISQQNIANQEIWNLGISYPFRVNDWWSVYFSLNAYTSTYNATNPDYLAITQETLSFYAQNTISLPWEIKMEVSGWYSSPSVWGGTYNTDALGSLNIAFQKKFIKDKLSARLAFNDVLYTIPWSGSTEFGEVIIDGSGGGDSRTVAFTLSYNFGSKDVKKARDRKTGLEEEKDRVGS